MEDHLSTIRVYPGELRNVYYTSVLASRATTALEVIRLSLERLQIYEDKTLYELYEGQLDEEDKWRVLGDNDCPIIAQQNWQAKDTRFFLKRKRNASIVLAQLVSQYIHTEGSKSAEMTDLCRLDELSEKTMLSSLQARFGAKSIYTYAGTILVAVNPYYFFPIYNPKYTALYQGRALEDLPPHIFAIADRSYHSMLANRENQTVIISGESGAGKTESTKFLLHHLMTLSAKMDESQSLELITLGTGPVLEAFGNARTVANNNSSRFGKFIQVQFKENGAYFGATIEKYLLEKSRIISQAHGERNYHVFYYLLAGADVQLRRRLKLLDLSRYCYLTHGSSLAPSEGAEEFHRLRQSLTMLSFSEQIQLCMFTVLSAILHIGNVVFSKDGEDKVHIQNMDTVSVVSKLLQVQEETLRLALTTKKSKAGETDFFVTAYRLDEAIAARDSLAKALYGSLFDWIVDQVNISLASSSTRGHVHKGHFIGVLDIFGFEVFQKNSFEQFCINYANEQLQQYFNKHIFKLDQAEYSAEGIEWSSVSFVDNQECLDLIARKPTGLLPLLDEESSFPGADDNSLFQKFERQHRSNPHYWTPQMRQRSPVFTIKHYASDVTYTIQGFREKNRDLMRQDIIDVLRMSHMDLVRALIGLLPYAVHRWHTAHLKIVAAFAFRRAGEVHRRRREGGLTSSLHHKLRRGSTPPMPLTQHDGPLGITQSYNYSYSLKGETFSKTKGTSVDAFSIDSRHYKKTGLGIRTSRSYDFLSDAASESPNLKDTSGMKEREGYISYGMSPRFPRRKQHSTSSDVPDSPSFLIIPPSSNFPPPPAPPSPPSVFITAESSLPAMLPSTTSSSTTPPRSPSQKLPSLEEADISSYVSAPVIRLTHPAKDHHPHRPEMRSRLPSISHLQEKLRKRWPRSLRLGGGGERGQKYWKTTPRMRDTNPLNDPRLIHSLVTSASIRHGPSKTVSGQFQVSLIALMETLEKTSPHFVRCLKSNNQKAPCQFNDELVLRQLRYTGMMQTVKIRKAGYSVRMSFEDFYNKYEFLIGVKSSDLSNQIDQFLKRMDFTKEHFQVGKTKVFMREAQKHALEDELREKVLARIVVIQRWTRAKLLRCRFLHIRRCTVIIQSALRGWMARSRVDVMRLRVCKAVEIQAAWRGFVERKKYIRLKQASIILQAYWRGQLERRRYVERLEERRIQEERLKELKRREEEEEEEEEKRRREEEEKQRKEELEGERREKELKERKETSVRVILESGVAHQLQIPESTNINSSIILDVEVSATLFHFDTIISELERSTLEGITPLSLTPRSLSPSEQLLASKDVIETLSHLAKDKLPPPGIKGEPVNEKEETAVQVSMRNGEKSKEIETSPPEAVPDPSNVQPKVRISDIQHQFLHHPQVKRDVEVVTRDALTPGLRGNVKSLIAQMQRSSTESSPSSDAELRDAQTKSRPRSASITHKISMLTHQSTTSPSSADCDLFEKEPTPVIGRSISEIAQGFETKRQDSDADSWASVPFIPRKKVQSPFILTAKDRSLEETHKQQHVKFEAPDKQQHVKFGPPDKQQHGKFGLPKEKSSATTKTTQSKEVTSPWYGVQREGTGREDDTKKHISNGMSPPFSPTLLVESMEDERKSSVLTSHAYSPSRDKSVTTTVPAEPLLSPPAGQPYRFRSISDVSHNTRILSSFRTESSITGAEPENESLAPLRETPYHKKKRNVVSVADPTDIISNLHLAHIPLEDSSELTNGLSAEEVRRLNQKQERTRSPSDRLKLFSFSKRHLRLPFGRGRSKREKQGNVQERSNTSPKRKNSKRDTPSVRNKRLSRTQAEQLLAHTFIPAPVFKGSYCGVCHKGFSGFMKQCLQCSDCSMVIHRHCEYRTPPCKAQIGSGSYVTMSRRKVVKQLSDLDDLTQFLLQKISLLTEKGSSSSKVDMVFEAALFELHGSLVSNYSLTLQKSLESSEQNKEKLSIPEESTPAVTITFSQLVHNFANIFRGIAKRHGLSDPSHVAISINQMKAFLDEFSKGRRRSMVKVISGNIEPATLRRKTISGRDLELLDHNGHRFFIEQFKVATVCEYCNDPIRLLEKGMVCQVCGYTCHEGCLKLTTKRCEGKERAKSPSFKQEARQRKTHFGVPLEQLVPKGSPQVPIVLEKCLQYIEDHGLYVQGIYRKSPGASSKKAVKVVLNEDPYKCVLDGFHVNAVAAAVGAFFRELPQPLLTKDLYAEFTRTIDLTDREERLEALHHLIGRLPELNHAVFERLIFHLARVAQHDITNKMTPYNLAVIFAPCLFQGDSKNPQDLLKDLAKQTICLELIIEEQVEKLNATLRGIETLSVVARDTASKLTELIGTDEVTESSKPPFQIPSRSIPARSLASTPAQRVENRQAQQEEEEERKRLTSELQEIERERVELTVNLPKLEPFTRDHHASWVIDSREPTPVLEPEDRLPPLPTHSLLPALTKNRVSQKPRSRLPSRKAGAGLQLGSEGSDSDNP